MLKVAGISIIIEVQVFLIRVVFVLYFKITNDQGNGLKKSFFILKL